MMKGWIGNAAAAGVMALALAACTSEIESENPGVEDRSGDPMAEVLGDIGSFSSFSAAMESTGLNGALEGEANYTVFAPSDTAFEALGEEAESMVEDEANGALVAAILREHMVPGALTPESIRDAIDAKGGSVELASFGSSALTLALDGETVTVSNANGDTAALTGAAYVASNGVVLEIDGLLADASALDVPETGEE